ncbi:trigger factor [Flavobacterium agricola]|uniref:Trigger factor n=1 Tax=Flavobacterium agricola TaxID=2870839 RepID=A0ABY6LX45_9FLAO|nr:trigger factor [Flavobacterium agricola]UYW00736.1 trigger factor [Flavobacterium agricola]
MNITKTNVDALNAVVTIEVAKEDYASKVEKILGDYRKTASIPGFRKGAVPMSLIKKQYGKAVVLDEVNKLLQERLNQYLVEEKIEILGNPIPKETKEFDFDADAFTFEFELGLAPEFSVDLSKANVTRYNITVSDEMLEEQLERIQKQFGALVTKEKVEDGDDLKGTFVNEEAGINHTTSITVDTFKRKTDIKKFIGKKVGDVVTVNTKGLFDDEHKLMEYLGLDHEAVHGLDVEVQFTIEGITTNTKAELNQELFDKLFGAGVVNSVEELKEKIKEDALKQFEQQADQKFLNDVTESLLENTKFELPAEFLKKWIQTVGETPLTADQAEEEFAKSEKGLRYQLIEGKVVTENNLQLTFEEIKTYAATVIKQQMAQFGQTDPSDADVENIVNRVLSNQEEAKRLSDQIMSEKIVNLFKDKVKATSKDVTFDEFVKVMYGEA